VRSSIIDPLDPDLAQVIGVVNLAQAAPQTHPFLSGQGSPDPDHRLLAIGRGTDLRIRRPAHHRRHGWRVGQTRLLRAWKRVAKAVCLREFGHLDCRNVDGLDRDRHHVETVGGPWSLHHWCPGSDESLKRANGPFTL